MKFLLAFLLVLLSGASLAVTEPNVVQVQQGFQTLPLNEATVSLRDSSNTLKIADMAKPEVASRFEAMPLDFGNAFATYWTHIKIHNSSDAAVVWWLDTNNRFLPEIEVFSRNAGGGFDAQAASASRAFHDRPLPFANFVFPLQLAPNQTLDVYVRAKTLGILRHSIDLKLWEPEAYKAYFRQVEVRWFFYLGMSVGLALFNLFLYFSIKDTNYLIYVGSVFAQIWRTSDNGIAYEYFWPDSPFFEQVLSRGLSIIVLLILNHYFVCRFIELPRLRPREFRWLTWTTAFSCGLLVFTMSSQLFGDAVPLSVFHFSQRLFVVILVVYFLYILYTLIAWAWAGNRHARSLLIAFSPLLILTGLVVPVLALLKINVNWTIPPTMIGSATAMILMSIALADRLKEAQQAKETAQRDLVDGLHLKERELESRVEERTRDLKQASHAFQSVLENAQDAVVLTDQNGRITNWNRQAESTFGWTQAEVLGQDIATLIFPARSQSEIAATILRQQTAQQDAPRRESTAIRRDGSECPIELSLTSVNVRGQFEFSFFIRDITQRRKAEMEITESLTKQRELAELKTQFVTMASHEFRTPLTSILSSSELLNLYSDRLGAEDRVRIFETIDNAVKRMTNMLEDVLLIGESGAGISQFRPVPLDLKALCTTIVEETKRMPASAKAAGHVIEFQMHGEIEKAIFDERWLRHIFSNLLSNAIKYSPAGGVVRFEVTGRPDEVEFLIADQGIGLPEADLPRLFEPFFRASNTGKISGTGLGLSIVKHAVDLHGGRVSVESVVGQGTSFKVVLPLRKD